MHSAGRRHWRELRPYHARMPRLRVTVVASCATVRYVVPAETALLALDQPFTDGAEFRAAILPAAEAGAAATVAS